MEGVRYDLYFGGESENYEIMFISSGSVRRYSSPKPIMNAYKTHVSKKLEEAISS
jgi:hypothetical protein